MSTAVPVIAVVSPTYRMAYIHHIAAQMAHMYVRRRIQFPRMCVINWRPWLEQRDCSAPHPTLPDRLSRSEYLSTHGRTDVMAMKDALGGWIGGGPMHAQCWTHARWVAVPVPAHQRRQPPRLFPYDADHWAGRPPPPRYMGLIAGHQCLDRRP